MNKIKSYSSLLSKLFFFLSIAYPLLGLSFWVFYDQLSTGLKKQLTPIPLEYVAWNNTTLILSVLAALPGLILSWLLLKSFGKLFSAYAKGNIFNPTNCALLHKIAKTLALIIFLEVLMNPVVCYILIFQNTPLKGLMKISISTHQIQWLLASCVIFVLSKIQLEAAKLSDESKLTI